MPRLVTKTAHGPHQLPPQDKDVWICMCGLSKNQPFCDSSHKKTLDEDDAKLYKYDADGKRRELKSDEGCCGGGCCEGGCCGGGG